MKSFISFSGGVESTTMCVLYGNKADAIFADTGFEHQALYERIDIVENWCQKFHGRDFKIHKIKNKKYGSLPEYIKEYQFYPSFKQRYCTRLFKIEPIDDFLEQYRNEGVELMIGLNATEIDQRTGNHGNKKFVKYTYPLAENNLTRRDCKIILEKAGIYPYFPVYMKRGGCVGCFYKSVNEFIAMACLNPEDFKIVEELEETLKDKRKQTWRIKNISMKKIKEISKMGFFKPEEIYPTVNDLTKCGVFCNR